MHATANILDSDATTTALGAASGPIECVNQAALDTVAAASAFANSLVLPEYRSGADVADGPEFSLSELFAGRCGADLDGEGVGELVPGVGGLVPGEGGGGTAACETAACERTNECGPSGREHEAAAGAAASDDALGNGALAAALGGAPTQAGAIEA